MCFSLKFTFIPPLFFFLLLILSDDRDLQSKKIAQDYYKKNMTKIKEKYYLLNIEQN